MNLPQSAPRSNLQRLLAQIGWEPRCLDVDLSLGRIRFELHRLDGRWVSFTADRLGRMTIERWKRSPKIERCFGDGPEFWSTEDTFLGRTHCDRGLRDLASYLTDNPFEGSPQLSADDILKELQVENGQLFLEAR